MIPYLSANEFYRQKFGCKVYKLSIDAGFTCPNRDGSLGTGGCIFCDGSGAFSARGLTVTQQLQNAKCLVEKKNPGGKYIAYFQAFTNTYAPVDTLRKLYYEAIAPDEIVGLSVATRPDCLADDVVDLLAEMPKPVIVELGLQTSNDEVARFIGRGYLFSVYQDAVKRLREKGIEVITHIILGLPGEDAAGAMETTRATVAAGTNGVKFHLLHVLKDTPLEKMYAQGSFSCLTMEEYGKILKECISCLPPDVVVHRITGDGAKKDLIAPLWSADKKKVLNYLNSILQS